MKLELVDPNGTIKTCVLLVNTVLYIAVLVIVLVHTRSACTHVHKHMGLLETGFFSFFGTFFGQ